MNNDNNQENVNSKEEQNNIYMIGKNFDSLEETEDINNNNNNNTPVVNNNVTEAMIKCDKCQTVYPSSQRYCMKCGALNYSHPENQFMKQYINYSSLNPNDSNSNNTSFKHNSIIEGNNKIGFLTFNILFTLIIICLWSFFYFNKLNNDILKFIGVLIGIFAFSLYNYCNQLIFIKAKKKWWNYWIPFYNIYVLNDIVFKKSWLFILLFVPVINIFYLLALIFNLAKKFNANSWLMIFLMPIMIPIIAFKYDFYEPLESQNNEKINSINTEKIYKIKKNIFRFCLFIIFLVLAYIFRKQLYDFIIYLFNLIKKYLNDLK